MARPPKEPPITTTLLPAVLRAIGQPVEADAVSLPLDAIEDRLDEIAMLTGEPDLGLSLPTRITSSRYGFDELAVRASDTVDSALSRLAKYAPLAAPGATGSADGGTLRIRFPLRARKPSRVLHEWALAHALHVLRVESGAHLIPTRVWFVHARPRDLGPVHIFFGTTVLDFGCEDDGFVLAPDDLRVPLRARDARLAATMDDLATAALENHAQPASYAERVERAIRLPETSIEAVAASLHASPRTVQRRLEAEGTNYSEILDRARSSLARRSLRETDTTIAEIAAALGFSDVAPFTRAFRRWTGMPPGLFRQRCLDEAARRNGDPKS